MRKPKFCENTKLFPVQETDNKLPLYLMVAGTILYFILPFTIVLVLYLRYSNSQKVVFQSRGSQTVVFQKPREPNSCLPKAEGAKQSSFAELLSRLQPF